MSQPPDDPQLMWDSSIEHWFREDGSSQPQDDPQLRWDSSIGHWVREDGRSLPAVRPGRPAPPHADQSITTTSRLAGYATVAGGVGLIAATVLQWSQLENPINIGFSLLQVENLFGIWWPLALMVASGVVVVLAGVSTLRTGTGIGHVVACVAAIIGGGYALNSIIAINHPAHPDVAVAHPGAGAYLGFASGVLVLGAAAAPVIARQVGRNASRAIVGLCVIGVVVGTVAVVTGNHLTYPWSSTSVQPGNSDPLILPTYTPMPIPSFTVPPIPKFTPPPIPR